MLHSDWFTEKRIDFEYQSYRLLAYLQMVNHSFNKGMLYPFLTELISHKKNLLHLKNEKQNLSDKFPKELTKIDLKNLNLEYTFSLNNDAAMEEINSIVDFSLPRIGHYIDEGNAIYSIVKDKITIVPVGIIPIYTKEGYILVSAFSKGKKKANVYYYSISLFVNELARDTGGSLPLSLTAGDLDQDLYCNIQTKYVTSVSISAVNTFENIKTQLIKRNPQLPNPATFAVESELYFPVNETLLPVAKKLLLNYIVLPVPGKPKAGTSEK